MATSRSFGEFAKHIKVIADRIPNNVGKVMKSAALAGDQVLATTTPVDTGRSRGSWHVAIGTPFPGDDIGKHPFGTDKGENAAAAQQLAMVQASAALAGYKYGDGPIYLSNGVYYIDKLDRGFSPQAPQGMTMEATTIMRMIIKQAQILGK